MTVTSLGCVEGKLGIPFEVGWDAASKVVYLRRSRGIWSSRWTPEMKIGCASSSREAIEIAQGHAYWAEKFDHNQM